MTEMTPEEAIAEVKLRSVNGQYWPGSYGNADVATTILNAVASGQLVPKADADLAVAEARDKALEEAAAKAEREGVYPELNVWNGGPQWYRHGKRIAAAIRALKGAAK